MKDNDKIIFDGEEYDCVLFNVLLPKEFRRTLRFVSSDTELYRNIFKYPAEMIEDDSKLILKYIHKKSVLNAFFKAIWEITGFTSKDELITEIKKELLQVSYPKGDIHFIRNDESDKTKEDSIKRVIVITCTNFYIEKIDEENYSFILECRWLDGTKTYKDFYKRRYVPPFIDPFPFIDIDDKDGSSLYLVKMREFTFPPTNKFKEIIRGKKEDDDNEKKM